MRYRFLSTFADYKAAQSVYVRSSAMRRVVFHFFSWGMLVLGLVCLALFLQINPRGLAGGIAVGVIDGLVGVGVAYPVLRYIRLRRNYKLSRGPLSSTVAVYVEIAEGMLISGVDGKSEGRFYRSAICEVVDADGVLLLFLNKKMYLAFMKSALPAEAFDEIRAWLALPGAPARC